MYEQTHTCLNNRCSAELFCAVLRNLKLEFLMQFSALNDEKYLYL